MCVDEGVGKDAWLKAGDVCNQGQDEGVSRDVVGHSEGDVRASLGKMQVQILLRTELTWTKRESMGLTVIRRLLFSRAITQFAFRIRFSGARHSMLHIKDEHQVARRKSALLGISWVPG